MNYVIQYFCIKSCNLVIGILTIASNIGSFLVGLFVGGLVSMILLLCICWMKTRRGMLPSSHSVDYQPSKIYEDVDICSTKLQDLQLQENVAYGQVKR